jgi:hypothetical protein
MKKLLLASTMLGALAIPAHADFVFNGEVDTTALGFGDVHRLQDDQLPTNRIGSTGQTGDEVGTVSPTSVTITPTVCTGDANCSGSGDKDSTPTLTALGWTSGARVGLGVDISQTGALSDGLNLNSFGINVYDSTGTNILATFSLGSPFLITAAMGHNGPGNGTDVFDFVLTLAEQQQWDAFNFASGDVIGSFVNWGCSGTVSPTCQPANDGPDSLLGFAQVPGPVVGAGLPGLVAACLGLIGLGRRRRRQGLA